MRPYTESVTEVTPAALNNLYTPSTTETATKRKSRLTASKLIGYRTGSCVQEPKSNNQGLKISFPLLKTNFQLQKTTSYPSIDKFVPAHDANPAWLLRFISETVYFIFMYICLEYAKPFKS